MRPAPNACDTSVSRPEQQAHRKYARLHEYRAADADCADRLGPERSDHQRVDQPHRDPANLGNDDRHRQGGHRPDSCLMSWRDGIIGEIE